MNNALVNIVSKILEKVRRIGFKLADEKEINYGVQLTFEKNGKTIKLNIYHSQKKGYSFVFPKTKDSSEKKMLENLIEYFRNKDKKEEHDYKIWLGTDESGKGDFFGALCVAGFVSDNLINERLKSVGIQDSKNLSDERIERLAKYLYANFKDKITAIVLMPNKYNELYEKFSLQRKKLNHLLAWMHGRIILDSYKNHKFDAAIIDKFVDKRVILSSLKDLKNIKIVMKVKGESDMAVAAASVIARYHFVQSIKRLEIKYGMKFPKGASEKVKETARDFIKKFGKEKLRDIAKIHFKTYNDL